jgi:hypothetical protein
VAISTAQETVTTTASVICVVPPGGAYITLSVSPTSSSQVVVGVSSAVKASNGSFPNYTPGGFIIKVGGKHNIHTNGVDTAQTLWGICTAGTSTVSVFVSDDK